MNKLNQLIYNFFKDYIDNNKRDQLLPFPHTYYNHSKTMFEVSNEFPTFILSLDVSEVRVTMRCLDLLKHLHDPIMGCNIVIGYDKFKDLVGKTSYHKAIKTLRERRFLIDTPIKSIKIVNIHMAHKLPNPKFDIDNVQV